MCLRRNACIMCKTPWAKPTNSCVESRENWKEKSMPSDISPTRKHEIQERIRLLEAVDSGKLDELICPQCGEAAVFAWFSRSPAGRYFTWCLLDSCDFEVRAQNTAEPRHYSKERDFTAPQQGMIQALRQMAERGATGTDVLREAKRRLGGGKEVVPPAL